MRRRKQPPNEAKTTWSDDLKPPTGGAREDIQTPYISCSSREGLRYSLVLGLVKLTASGNTSKAVSVEPSRLNFGRIVYGHTKRVTCHVDYTGDVPLDVVDIERPGSESDIQWRILDMESARGRVSAMRNTAAFVRRNMRALEISFTPRRDELGRIEGELSVYTNIKDFERIIVPFEADVVQPVVLSPGILFLRETASENTLRQTVTAWSPGGDRFRIVGIDNAGTGLEATYAPSDAERMEISSVGQTGDLKATPRGEITVFIKLQGDVEGFPVRLPVYMASR